VRPRAPPAALLALARAQRLGRRARVRRRDAAGDATEREVEVFALAFQEGRWYAFVHCRLRRAPRLLRVDRTLAAATTRRAARMRPPPGFDAAFFASSEYLEPGAASAHLVTVRLAPPLAAAAGALLPSAAIERDGRDVLCHVRASRPALLARLVRSLGAAASLADVRFERGGAHPPPGRA
jgi:predicted DNA-binding transcriptional regulator YafY